MATPGRAGTMAVLLGGDVDVAARWRPVIETFAVTIELLGQVGAGQLAKLVNNALSSVTIGASSWALAAGEELGLDREALTRVIAGSSGNSFMLRRAADLTAETAGFAAARLRKTWRSSTTSSTRRARTAERSPRRPTPASPTSNGSAEVGETALAMALAVTP